MKICLIGAGNIAEAHLKALRAAGAEVTAVCTRGDSGRQFAARHDLHYYPALTTMLTGESPQGVYLLTQPAAYAELLAVLKRYDLPVMIEKPVGYSSAHARQLRDGLPALTMVGHNRRFYANLEFARAMIGASPVSAHFFICERARDIQHRDQADHNRWHVMNAIHGIDTIRYLFGDVVAIPFLHRSAALSFSSLPRLVHADLVTERGHRVRFASNFDSPGGWRCFVFTEQREIVIEPIEKTVVRRIGAHDVFETPADDRDFKPGFLAQARTFLAGVAHPDALPAAWVGFDDAMQSISLCETLYEGQSY